jgi:hypothetical protein
LLYSLIPCSTLLAVFICQPSSTTTNSYICYTVVSLEANPHTESPCWFGDGEKESSIARSRSSSFNTEPVRKVIGGYSNGARPPKDRPTPMQRHERPGRSSNARTATCAVSNSSRPKG